MRKSVIAIIIIVLVVLYMSVFVVKEGERGITLRFGKVLRDDDNKPLVYEPGLHFKIPFIETVKMLDARIQTMDNQADRFVTKEKKDLIVDSYIKWRISDFSRYYLATGGGDISQAEVLLKRKFSDRLRSEIGQHPRHGGDRQDHPGHHDEEGRLNVCACVLQSRPAGNSRRAAFFRG